jgi:hypothetical protein
MEGEMKWSSSGFLGVQLSQTTLVLAWLGLALAEICQTFGQQ